MLKFHPVTLRDKDWIDEIVAAEDSPSADYNFGNIFIWDKRYRQLICRYGDRMLTKLRYCNHPAFVFPIGSGPLSPAVEALRSYADSLGVPFVLRGITAGHKALLEQEFPNCFEFIEDINSEDYIYLADKLATYSGKALHGKKNHCNRFEAENSWEFVPLTRELIPGCMDMLSLWTEQNAERLDKSISFEHDAIERAFAAFEPLKLEGGVLLVSGKIIGFTLGEMANSDTFDVHFEKADPDINGAYTMVCRELSKMLLREHENLRFINREDDMGLENLRKSKLSYKPETILKKYTARWI